MILDNILSKVKARIKEQKETMSLDYLQRAMLDAYEPRNVIEALSGRYNIIAEIKKASPSRGVICEDFHPLNIAQEYEKAGASAISVLTEPYYFQGDIEYLGTIRRFTNSILLRKDFLIDPYQIARARLYGADFVLLIARILKGEALKEMISYAKSIKMQALVEVHNEAELGAALDGGADIIGINHRDLDTLTIDMSLTQRLIGMIPRDKIIVAESGINSRAVMDSLNAMGVNAFLIGEYFMQANSPGQALKELLGR